MNDPPLLEGTGSTRGGSSIASESTNAGRSSGIASGSEFAITIQTADGSHTIDAEELLVYASLIQTLLLLAVTYHEMKS